MRSHAVPRLNTRRRELRLAYICLAPAVLLLACVFIYPIVSTLLDSVSRVSPFGGRTAIGTLDNWRSILGDSVFTHGVLPRTVVWTAGVVSVTVLLSIPAALLLHAPFRGRKWARTAMLLPWAVPLPISAILWRFILDGQIGTLNALLAKAGIQGPVWLAQAGTAFPMVVWVGVWASVPFTVVTLLAGLQGIGVDVVEAATLDGATGFSLLRYVTLPLLRPVLNVAVVLNTVYVFNSFPIIWVLTQGGPAGSTDTLITYLYKTAFRFSRPGPAQAMGVVSFAVLLLFSWTYLRITDRGDVS
jgi:multiple sugar transport system permease protein